MPRRRCASDGRHADRDRDERRDEPVVADHELPPEAAERGEPLHAVTASRRSRSQQPHEDEREERRRIRARRGARRPIRASPLRRPPSDQKIPNVVSITPTANFMRSPDPRERRADGEADARDEHERASGAGRRERDRALRAAEREDDEHDLEPLQQHAFEREDEAVPVDARALDVRRTLGFGKLPREDRVLVVECLVAARAQDRLPQPLQAEDEQQRADDEPQSPAAGSPSAPARAPRDDRQHERRRADPARRSASRARARRRARSSAPPRSRRRSRGTRRGQRNASPVLIKGPSDPWAEGTRAHRPRLAAAFATSAG